MYRTRGDETGGVSLVSDKPAEDYWHFLGKNFEQHLLACSPGV
jgi:hypothetical protein